MLKPPSTIIDAPVIKDDWLDAKNITTFATSSGFPILPKGCCKPHSLIFSLIFYSLLPTSRIAAFLTRGVSIVAGNTALHLISGA